MSHHFLCLKYNCLYIQVENRNNLGDNRLQDTQVDNRDNSNPNSEHNELQDIQVDNSDNSGLKSENTESGFDNNENHTNSE